MSKAIIIALLTFCIYRLGYIYGAGTELESRILAENRLRYCHEVIYERKNK